MALAIVAMMLATSPEIVVTAPRLDPPFAVHRVGEGELAAMRGRLLLPNGLDVAIGIDIQTRVDGILVLHTIYASEGANPGVRVFTDGAGAATTAPATVRLASPSTTGTPVVIVDRSPTGTTILPTAATAAATVNLVNGDPSTWLTSAGQTEVPVTANGPAVDAQPGAISLRSDAGGAVVMLTTPDLQIRQLIGQATGVVVANTGSDRTIDTVSSVNVDLNGISPATFAAVFAAQRAVFDAFSR